MKHIHVIGIALTSIQIGQCTELFLSDKDGVYMQLPAEVSFAISHSLFRKKTIVGQSTMQLFLSYLKEMDTIKKDHPRFLWAEKITGLSLTTKPEELVSLIELAISLQQIEVAHGIARRYVEQELSHSFQELDDIPEHVEEILRKQYFLYTRNAVILSYINKTDSRPINLTFSLREITCNVKTPIIANKLDLSRLHLGSLEGIQAFDHPFVFNIDLSHNDLKELPEEIGALTYLTKLNLGFNALEKLPNSLGNLHNLTRLDVRHNHLTTIPSSIQQLDKLEQFDCSYNLLKELPEELFFTPNLSLLNLSHNDLETIPPAIENLTKLHYFNVQHNRLTNLPRTIKNLPMLSQLRCKNNPELTISRSDIPESVILFDEE